MRNTNTQKKYYDGVIRRLMTRQHKKAPDP